MSKGNDMKIRNNNHKHNKMFQKGTKKKTPMIESLKNRKQGKLLKNGSYLRNKKTNSCIESEKVVMIFWSLN